MTDTQARITAREPHAIIRKKILDLLDDAIELTGCENSDIQEAANALLESVAGAWVMLVASTDCSEEDIYHDAERLATVAIKVQRTRRGKEAA